MKKPVLTYKGYTGHVEFDDEAGIFHGEVLGLKDVVTFQGSSVDDLRASFRDSIDDYLEFYEERGVSPRRGAPFPVELPNAETKAAINTVDAGEVNSYDSIEDLKAKLSV